MKREEQQLYKIERELYEQKEKARQVFARVHEDGSNRFGTLWLSCNIDMSELRNSDYLPENDSRVNALLTEAAYVMTEREEKHREKIAMLKEFAKDVQSDLHPVEELIRKVLEL